MSYQSERNLYVASRRPDGLIEPVGVLSQYSEADETRFRFVYLKLAERQEGFTPLPGLPDIHQVYVGSSLFPVFANRLMPRDRADYGAYVDQLDLTVEADPFEVLARSEGVRATDRVEVFPAPVRIGRDELSTLFFARGIRHIEEAAQAVDALAVGDELQLIEDAGNPVNPRALILSTRTGATVGWAPDYLLDLLHELRDLNGEPARIFVEHVNPSTTPPHLRLLCRMSATWPAGYEPFSGPEFQSLA